MIFSLWSFRSAARNLISPVVLKFQSKYGRLAAVCTVLPAMMCATRDVGFGQKFDGYQSPQSVVVSTGLSSPNQVAVDGLGNIYIADAGNNRILMETPSGVGYTQSTVPSSSLSGPLGVAVDGAGNVYIADSSNGRVLKETLSGGSYTESVVSPNGAHRRPQCLAVDGNGNVFVADPGYAALFEETPSGGSYAEIVIPVQYNFTGSATEVAVDQNGNLYVTTGGGANAPVVVKLVPSGNSYVVSAEVDTQGALSVAVDKNGNVFLGDNGLGVREQTQYGSLYLGITVDENLIYPSGVAADNNGHLYVADYKNNRVVKDTVWNGDFGSVNIGATSPTLSLIFRNNSFYSVAMGTPRVVTQGVTGLDFIDAGTGSCTTNGPAYSYASGASCTVDVVLTPKIAGPRYGAVNFTDNSGNVVTSGFVRGAGTGPQLQFLPGTQSQLSLTGVTNPYAIASDGVGNLYIAEAVTAYSASNAVVKETWNGNGYTQTSVATGLAYPVGVAVDGAGNVFIADQDASAIVEAMPSNGGYAVHAQFAGVGNVEGVAVDGNGNVYFASNALGVVKESYEGFGWGFAQSTISRSVFAAGIAVDGQGNIYLGDGVNDRVLVESPANGSYTQHTIASDLNSPHSIAVDGVGNVYVVDRSSVSVLKEIQSGGSYTQSSVASAISDPSGVAVDGLGRVYYTSDADNGVWQIDYSDAPNLHFAATPSGETSADSPQTVTIANAGNAALAFPIPSMGTNPSVTTDFSWDSSAASACPMVGAASSAQGVLAPGASCQVPISFSPQSVGILSGSLVLTDNSLNAAAPGYTSQSIALSGTGLQPLPTFTISPSPASLQVAPGANGTSTITVTARNGFAGSVNLAASGLPLGVTAVFSANPTNGTSVLTLTVSSTASLGSATVTITGTSGSLTSLTTISLTVSVPPGITVSDSPSSLTISRGGNGTSTVTVTPSGGFTGSVALSAAITSSPPGAQNLPTFSFGPSSRVSINGASAGTATLTITTTSATSATMASPKRPGARWYATVSATLACLLLFGFPKRRRRWLTMLGMVAFLVGLAGGLLACGSGGGSGGGKSGTTPGTYTVTVTGSSGNVTSTGSVTLTVQ